MTTNSRRTAEPRASRSGTATTPNAARRRPMVTLTLSPEILAAIEDTRGEESRSAWLEEAARQRLRSGR